MKRGFILNKNLVSICVCLDAQRDVSRDSGSGLNQIICESPLHVMGQSQYVERVLRGVVGVDPVWVSGL